MKKIKYLSILFSAILLLTFFIPIINADNSNNKSDYILKHISEKELNDNLLTKIASKLIDPEIGWFPGFFIVQLLKGVIALVLIILIIFSSFQP